MAEWKSVPVSKLAVEKGLVGGPFGSSLGSRDYVSSGVPVIRGTNLGSQHKFDASQFVFVTEEKTHGTLSRNLAVPGDVVFTQRGTLGQVGIVPKQPYSSYVISQSQMRLRVDSDLATPEFVYYQFKSPEMLRKITDNAIATGVPHINLGILGSLDFRLPPVSYQRAIVGVLGALDDKIAANERIAATAQEIMRSQYTFTVQSSASPCALGEIAAFHNKRRVPLSSRQRAEFSGTYPYYGAAGVIDHVREFIFSGPHVLVGEDGSVITDDRKPVTQYVWGDFWVNNHAHILTGKDISTELLAVALRFTDVSHLITGAVQPKLNMRNLSKLEIILPHDGERPKLEQMVEQLTKIVRRRTEESRTLAAMRDTLLPQLMSGKLRVRDAERIMEDAT